MKYIIDVEIYKDTDLYKAKEFNTLVFDKNGLMKLIAFEDELGCYYADLREEIYRQKREINLLVKTHKKLRDEKTDIKRENEKLEGKTITLKDEIEDLEELCMKLQNEKAELLKKYEGKCLEVESLLDTGKPQKE